jgi:hypothetical protein
MFRKVFRIFAVVIKCNLGAFMMRMFQRFVFVAGNLIKAFLSSADNLRRNRPPANCALWLNGRLQSLNATNQEGKRSSFLLHRQSESLEQLLFRARRNLYYYHYFSREVSKRRSNQR